MKNIEIPILVDGEDKIAVYMRNLYILAIAMFQQRNPVSLAKQGFKK